MWKSTRARLIERLRYVGYEEGGALTEAVSEALSNCLFDEIEKALLFRFVQCSASSPR